ncbi:hypothetical protein [Macrococcoides canis]|uniref:hypothetical protein n=1 Tax=Macrococcoides canis TaxID=1855823 RepID=UPI00105BFC58|nr:hypothetical protein [Macrococcus canis]TDM34390.1 hypothetical protein ETI13_00995 [Macrococcus canis]
MNTTVIYTTKQLPPKSNLIKHGNIYHNIESEKDITFFGAGVINKTFYTSQDSKYHWEVSFSNDPEQLQMSTRGSLCTYVKSELGFKIIPDPIARAMTFYYSSPGLFIVSNDIKDIIQSLKLFNIEPKRDYMYNLETIALPGPGYTQSPYKDIKTLEPFEYIEIFQNNFKVTKNKKLSDLIDYAKQATLDDAIDHLKSDIISNIDAFSNYKVVGDRICQLTGGFDSRLVLAGIKNLNRESEWLYFCSGPKGTPDKDTFVNLCKHYNLISTNYNGIDITNFPESHTERLKWDLEFSGGMSLNIHKYMDGIGNVAMGGAYGENVRNNYNININFDEYLSYDDFIDQMYPNINHKIFKSAFKTDFSNKFREKVIEYKSLGLPSDSILDYFHISIQNRYHFGNYVSNTNKVLPRFDPLYNIHAMFISLFLPRNIRKQNIIGLRVMHALYKEMLELPFDKEKITPLYEEMYGKVNKKSFSNQYTYKTKNVKYTGTNNRQSTQLQKNIDTANKLGVNYWQVTEMENAREGVKNIIDSIPNEIKDMYLNTQYINEILNNPFKDRSNLRMLHNLYSSLLSLTI